MAKTANLKKIKKTMEKILKELGIDGAEYTLDEKKASVLFDISLKAYDDVIIAHFEYFANSMAAFTFTFDHLQINSQTLRMINEANQKLCFFFAYIDAEKEYLRMEHSCFHVNEDEYYDYACSVINEFVDDDTIEILKPLCILSEGD